MSHFFALHTSHALQRMYLVLQVAELIAGLQELGCTRTTGEDQTICILSDSFDYWGNAAVLQELGDLPQVEVVKVRYEWKF